VTRPAALKAILGDELGNPDTALAPTKKLKFRNDLNCWITVV